MSKLKIQTKFLGNHNAKAKFETKDSNSLITSLSLEYIGEFMTLNQKDPMLWGGGGIFIYKLTPQLIKFNIRTHD